MPARTQQQTLRKIDDARLREIVAGYSAALERGDADALVALLTEDVTWSMPPLPHWYRGLDAVTDFARADPARRLRLVAAPADQRERPAGRRLLPAATTPPAPHLAWSIDVLTLRGDRIAGVTSFIGPEPLRAASACPPSLP